MSHATFRLLVEKMSCADKEEQEAEVGEASPICLIGLCIPSALSGVLTPDVFGLDESFHAPGSLEMEEIVRRSGSMKLTDHEIWLAFSKDEIRSASRLRDDYRPLRI